MARRSLRRNKGDDDTSGGDFFATTGSSSSGSTSSTARSTSSSTSSRVKSKTRGQRGTKAGGADSSNLFSTMTGSASASASSKRRNRTQAKLKRGGRRKRSPSSSSRSSGSSGASSSAASSSNLFSVHSSGLFSSSEGGGGGGDPDKKIFLIRHAVSVYNMHKMLYGEDPMVFDAPLTKFGAKQARVLQRYIDGCDIDFGLIVVSPLTRALQTMTEAFRHRDGVERVVMPEVRERCFASHDLGRSPQVLADIFPDLDFDHIGEEWWYTGNKSVRFDKDQEYREMSSYDRFTRYRYREPIPSVRLRLYKLKRWLMNRPEDNIAVVCHGDVIHTLSNVSRTPNCAIIEMTAGELLTDRKAPEYPFIIPPGLFDVHFDPIDADEMSGFLSSNASVNDPVGAPAGANTFYSGDSSNFFSSSSLFSDEDGEVERAYADVSGGNEGYNSMDGRRFIEVVSDSQYGRDDAKEESVYESDYVDYVL